MKPHPPSEGNTIGLWRTHRWSLWFLNNNFFFFFFFFLGLPLQHMEVPRLEVESVLQPPTYTQWGIRATSVISSTAHGNAGSLSYWARPGIKCDSSRILVRFIKCWDMKGTPFHNDIDDSLLLLPYLLNKRSFLLYVITVLFALLTLQTLHTLQNEDISIWKLSTKSLFKIAESHQSNIKYIWYSLSVFQNVSKPANDLQASLK